MMAHTTLLCTEAIMCLIPAEVDVLVPGVMKDGAAFDMFGDMQSPVSHTKEQLSTQLASQGDFPPSGLPVPISVGFCCVCHILFPMWGDNTTAGGGPCGSGTPLHTHKPHQLCGWCCCGVGVSCAEKVHCWCGQCHHTILGVCHLSRSMAHPPTGRVHTAQRQLMGEGPTWNGENVAKVLITWGTQHSTHSLMRCVRCAS